MSRVPQPLDMGVVIDRVRVCVHSRKGAAHATPAPRWPERARAGDHRIVVRELCIETDTALGPSDARKLGDEVARALGERLSAVQARRLDALLAGRTRGGVVRIGALRVHLRGANAERPNPIAVAGALAGAVTRRLAP